MPTKLDVVRRLRELRGRLAASLERAGVVRLILAALVVLVAGAVVLAVGVLAVVVSAMLSIASLNQLFGLELDPANQWNLAAAIWLWFVLYTLALSARSKPAKENKR